jgi:lipoprotein-releasing system ATP-binding protein
MSTLLVDNVTKEFPTRGEPLVVLRGISLELAAGDHIAVIGPSGSGKSTLLSILGTLDNPTSGSVRLAGQDPFALDESALARFRNERIGFIFQDHHLLPQCTALENVLIPLLAQGAAARQDVEAARSLLERIGLSGRQDHRPAELSGGERQRVAIARAMIKKPLLLLADEPTGNLDRTTAQKVADVLLALQAEERAILVVVTHSSELAQRLGRQLELDDGRLVPIVESRRASTEMKGR